MSYTRFAIFYLPPDGALADFGASWLGWDVARGVPVVQPALPGLDGITATRRSYGFHGTLKPPFRLADGTHVDALDDAVARMAAACAPARSVGLRVTRLGRFIALTSVGDPSGINRVAATCVTELDQFRAEPTEAEFAQRRKARLSDRQEALLTRWGYPHVMEEFRFHMTLTGRLSKEDIARLMDVVQAHLPDLPAPFVVDEVALVAERPDARFEMIRRYGLDG